MKSDNATGLIQMSKVKAKAVQWLWVNRIPKGRLTLVEGDGGLGKSSLTLEIAASVSKGRPLPGDKARLAAGVIILGAEDGIEDTVLPRLQAAGANLRNVFAFPHGAEVKLAEHLELIEAKVKEHKAALLIVDPLTYFLGADANKEQAVRDALTPLLDMAERNNTAIVAIRHFTKAKKSASAAGIGGVAIWALARSALMIGKHPTQQETLALVCHKHSLVKAPPSLSFKIGNGAAIRWCGETELTAEDVLKADGYNKTTALAEGMAFLQDALDEGALRCEKIQKLATQAGVAKKTLRRAKDNLKVLAFKMGFSPSRWYWGLHDDGRIAPEEDDEEAQAA